MIRKDEPAIVFMDEDARQLHHPHDVAIVITLVIANYTTRRMLIDNVSSTNIFVRLNLFNHLLALFRAKFSCNSASRNPVFRWESCKGSV